MHGAIERHLAFLRHHGVNGLMIHGSTGEFVHFEERERIEYLQWILARREGLAGMVNASAVNPRQVRRIAQAAEQAGADAVAVLPPWFFTVSPDDLTAFFVDAARSTTLPVLLYNFPERTGHRVGPDVIRAVASEVKVDSYKQSGAEFSFHPELVALGREFDFSVFTGADTRLAEAMTLGARGTISGICNAVPDLLSGVYAARRSGDSATEARLSTWLRALGPMLDTVPFPFNIAAMMEARGLETGASKLRMGKGTVTSYQRLVADLRAAYGAWGLPRA